MVRTTLWSRSLALAGALALGIVGSVFGTSACLVPDYCIVVATPGTDWCTQMEGAVMWPKDGSGPPVPVVDGEVLPPEGCACMNDGEDQLLLDQMPVELYLGLVEEIQEVARQNCVALVPDDYDHNCLQVVDDDMSVAPAFGQLLPGASNPECIGSCSYVGDPPFGQPCGDPDPWECNNEDPPGTSDTGGGETGGGEDTGGETGFEPVVPVDRLAR